VCLADSEPYLFEKELGEWSYYRFDMERPVGTCVDLAAVLVVFEGDGDIYASFDVRKPNYLEVSIDLNGTIERV